MHSTLMSVNRAQKHIAQQNSTTLQTIKFETKPSIPRASTSVVPTALTFKSSPPTIKLPLCTEPWLRWLGEGPADKCAFAILGAAFPTSTRQTGAAIYTTTIPTLH